MGTTPKDESGQREEPAKEISPPKRPPPITTSLIPAGDLKEPSGSLFEILDDPSNPHVMSFDFSFGTSLWTVRIFATSTRIDHRERFYGPYEDREIRVLYDTLVKYLAWEKQAKDTMPVSFEKELPGDLPKFKTDDQFAPSAVFQWQNEPAKEEATQDAFGARLSGLWGEKAKQESGAHALLTLHLSARDRVWGNALTTEEVREFVTCLEQIQRCRTRFWAERGRQMEAKAAEKKKEDDLKSRFK